MLGTDKSARPAQFWRGFIQFSDNSRIILGYSNIAGYYDLATTSGGALSACSRWTFSIVIEPGTDGGIININAASSNSIYGGSATVQPASLRGYMLIHYQ